MFKALSPTCGMNYSHGHSSRSSSRAHPSAQGTRDSVSLIFKPRVKQCVDVAGEIVLAQTGRDLCSGRRAEVGVFRKGSPQGGRE